MALKPAQVVVIALLLVILLGFIFLSYNRTNGAVEKFYAAGPQDVPALPKAESVASLSNPNPDAAGSGIGNYAPSDGVKYDADFSAVNGGSLTASPEAICFPRDRLTGEDLLPKDAANSKWAQMNPAGQGDVRDQNFLTAGYHIGINTVGQTRRNANYQLRSDPPNPQVPVSPWNISTIEPDLNRRPLEIGGDY